MKHSKLLKSAILSTALLYSGGALAQQTGDTKLTILNPPLTITASEVNFGTHTRRASIAVVTMSCNASGVATMSVAPRGGNVITGTCGAVTISTTSSDAVGFTASVTATAMTASGATDLAAPVLAMYLSGTSEGTSTTSSITTGTPLNVFIGGVVNLGASQAVGEYSGTYTITATIN